MLDDQDQKQHDLYDTPKCRLNQNSRHLWHLPRKLLSGKSEQVGGRDHANVRDGEDPNGVGNDEVEDDGYKGEWPEKIHILRDLVGGFPEHLEEVLWRETAAVTFSIRMDAMCENGWKEGGGFAGVVVRGTHDCRSEEYCNSKASESVSN